MNIQEMVAIIQKYIKQCKGIDVRISPVLPRDLPLLMRAYSIAINNLKK